jgi:hypothetical protein
MRAHHATWAAPLVVLRRGKLGGLAKIRGWSLGGGGICARDAEGWAVSDSWPPRDERAGPWGEAEKVAEALWEWLRL